MTIQSSNANAFTIHTFGYFLTTFSGKMVGTGFYIKCPFMTYDSMGGIICTLFLPTWMRALAGPNGIYVCLCLLRVRLAGPASSVFSISLSLLISSSSSPGWPACARKLSSNVLPHSWKHNTIKFALNYISLCGHLVFRLPNMIITWIYFNLG